MAVKTAEPAAVDVSIEIAATPHAIVDAFFDAAALARWCGALRSVTTPRVLGPYAIEWASDMRDDVLGRLGGVLRGTVMHFEPTRGFLVADVFWLPPAGHPVGPMALEVTCRRTPTRDGTPLTKVRVTQSGFEEGERWRRYYDVIGPEWQRGMELLKGLLEKPS